MCYPSAAAHQPQSISVIGTNTFVIGVILSVVADVIIAISLNVQKTAHMRNEGADGKPVKSMLKLPLWWLGLLLNVGGELGNMLAYGFAPASVVAPVGSVGVVANEVIAVVFLKEPFRWRDAAGLVAIVAGVVLIIFGVPEDPVELNAVVLQDEYYSDPVAYSYLIGLSCAVRTVPSLPCALGERPFTPLPPAGCLLRRLSRAALRPEDPFHLASPAAGLLPDFSGGGASRVRTCPP